MSAENDDLHHTEPRAADPHDAEPARPEVVDDLPSTGLLSFYDRLRQRLVSAVARRGGKMGATTAEALLLVPDVFMLLMRLALDKEVPAPQRALVSSALAYFVLPADLLPELVLGPTGYVDDLVLAAIVLSQAFGRELEPYAARHWSGPKKLRQVLRDVLDSANSLLGVKLYDRVRGLLAARGVELEDA